MRHQGKGLSLGALPKHIAYLKREGVTRDGADARMFDATSDVADESAFAERCEDDRHHFRFIISPEDAATLKTFARELMRDVEKDLGTRLDFHAHRAAMAGCPSVSGVVRLVMSGEGPARVPDEVIAGIRARRLANQVIAGLWFTVHWANLWPTECSRPARAADLIDQCPLPLLRVDPGRAPRAI